MNTPRILLAALVAAALPFAASAESDACKGDTPRVKLATTAGPIVLEINRAKAPATVDNFVKYVESGHYNGTIFHRVIDGFMIQGGGFTKEMQQKPTQAPIRIESKNGLRNEPYTVAMARTGDPNSATSQFFINVVDNQMLNYGSEMSPGYAVFGKVVQGQETVDKIRKVQTTTKAPHQNVPVTPVVIEKAECVAAAPAKGAAK